jgi:uncharacterized protein (TIGR03067 family)
MNALLIVGFVLAAPGVKDPPKKAEPPTLVGAWKLESMVGGGQVAPVGDLGHMTLEFGADGTLQIRLGDEKALGGTYKTVAGKDASEIDITVTAKNELAPGLFKVEKDTLTLCFDDRGKGAVRPSGFESPAGSRVMLMTLKRVEKKE